MWSGRSPVGVGAVRGEVTDGTDGGDPGDEEPSDGGSGVLKDGEPGDRRGGESTHTVLLSGSSTALRRSAGAASVICSCDVGSQNISPNETTITHIGRPDDVRQRRQDEEGLPEQAHASQQPHRFGPLVGPSSHPPLEQDDANDVQRVQETPRGHRDRVPVVATSAEPARIRSRRTKRPRWPSR